MNLVERAREGYGASGRTIRSHRASEYDAIARVSHRLRSAALNRTGDYRAFVSALHENRRLWSILAADVAQSDNALPQDLRARLFWLAEFVESESRALLRGTGDVGILIEINASVLQGLGTERDEA